LPAGATARDTARVRDFSPRQTRQLVLVGGGHAHVAVLKSFGMERLPEVRLVLISDQWDTPYSGMLPALIAGHYSRDEIHVDLHRLCRFAGGDFYRDRVTGLDLQARQVLLAERPPVHFDILSLNTGSSPNLEVPGAREFAVPVKPIAQLLTRLAGIEQRFLETSGRPFRIVTVGAGAGGVELTLSIRHRLKELAGRQGQPGTVPDCTLITAAPTILTGHNRRVQGRFTQLLAARGVRVLANNAARAVTANDVLCADGSRVAYDVLFWATNAAAPDWPRAAGLAVDEAGFIAVNPLLQSTSHDFVYAAGDVATMARTPRPKSGVFAVRQGPPLARNLRLALQGFAPKPYRPQRTYLSLISTGDKLAVASKGPFAAIGPALWRWKQWIDRRWLRQYQELPARSARDADMDFTARMKSSLRTDETDLTAKPARMRCGGCGAKLGGVILHAALRQVPVTPHPAVVIGLQVPDDAAVFSPPAGRLLVQSVDFFRSFINDPWLFGRIAANHALNDLQAMGATPLIGQATATLELAAERIMIERLARLLAGAAAQLAAGGATLVGGHSAEGAELALGLTVTGTAAPGQLFRKTGLRPGDQLLLTKPLGTGVLFAADSEYRLPARVLQVVIDNMLQSNAPAAAIFARAGVTTCTDVSGFGLLGHLREMLGGAASGLELWPEQIPAFPEALKLIASGCESSMVPANQHYLALLTGGPAAGSEPAVRLLLDPQTAGPLLAAVAEREAAATLNALKQAGFHEAAIIGRVSATTDPARPITLIPGTPQG
jgi:selenide, water dikinase